MKMAGLLRMAAGHTCIICGMDLLVIQILDWYNPFMDFMGHAMFVLYALCISAVCLGICEVYARRPKAVRRVRRRSYRKEERGCWK